MNKLTDQHFSFKCPMDFNAMQPSANGVFCGKCRKEVFDLTDCSIDEVIALQRKYGTICGSIRIIPLAAAAVTFSAAACCPSSTHGNYGETKDGGRSYVGVSGGEVRQPFELLKSK
ncbi:MAG: hypothetical protein ABIT37_13470 [Luteolibacter sp.]